MNKIKKIITIIKLTDLFDLISKYNSFKGWLFRGQQNYSWDLKSSLQRAANNMGRSYEELPNLEQGMIRKFQRHYFQFSQNIPHEDDYIEWLSIMQHYGCPTRMLDFSYSIFIALFFAIKDIKPGDFASIYCINTNWLKEKYEKKIATVEYFNEWKRDKRKKYKNLHKIILNNHKPFLYSVNPFYLNVRLGIQQGAFIIPTNIRATYMENLHSTIIDTIDLENIIIIKINCTQLFKDNTLQYLNKININESTLFPGLDGFSRYIKMLMVSPESLYSDTDIFL